jgi:hypothetical protein
LKVIHKGKKIAAKSSKCKVQIEPSNRFILGRSKLGKANLGKGYPSKAASTSDEEDVNK